MDIVDFAESQAASFLAAFSPSAKSLLDFVRAHPDLIRKLIPIVTAAAAEGPSVIDAVNEKAPETIKALKNLFDKAAPDAPIRAAIDHDRPLENALRTIAGVPHMTPEQEQAWIDRATPINDSRSGSG